jgi:hypothetical protein
MRHAETGRACHAGLMASGAVESERGRSVRLHIACNARLAHERARTAGTVASTLREWVFAARDVCVPCGRDAEDAKFAPGKLPKQSLSEPTNDDKEVKETAERWGRIVANDLEVGRSPCRPSLSS